MMRAVVVDQVGQYPTLTDILGDAVGSTLT
jgi:hypothetical protein